MQVALMQVPCPLQKLGHKVLPKSEGGCIVPLIIESGTQKDLFLVMTTSHALCIACRVGIVKCSVSVNYGLMIHALRILLFYTFEYTKNLRK